VDRVVLCAGVFHTPQILLRSGIGPKAHLNACGIEQVLDLPGVGEGFWDHAKYELEFDLRPRDEDRPTDGSEPWAGDPFGERNKIHLRLRSSLATEDPDLDLQLHPDTARGVMILTVRILEQRAFGTVRLDPDDPDGLPVIDSGMARDPQDVSVLVEGVLRGIELLQDPRLGGRYRLPETAPRSDEALREAVARGYGSYNHGVGTCRMGMDAAAVVDRELRVHGLENLFIADGSVLPVLPHVTTNYPVAIVAQWAAEHFLRTW
jgi:choline dehydrogenase